jgi:hypothetical protein
MNAFGKTMNKPYELEAVEERVTTALPNPNDQLLELKDYRTISGN